MGQKVSCGTGHGNELISAIQDGNMNAMRSLLQRDSSFSRKNRAHSHQSALHVAAANGQIEALSMLLDRSASPDVLNRHKQTPLMLAAMHGRIYCVKKLLDAGANVLKFDSVRGRTCLHYAAYYGHFECVEAILTAARTSPIAVSWGFARFVNIKDGKGATPLHLAARQRQPDCVHILLDSGALVCVSTGGYGCPGSTSLHLAARGGSLDCVRQLLAWGADRYHRDSSGKIPYAVALKYKHMACAALLNPSSAEPLVWPASLKFIRELDEDAKLLLEQALMEANREREKIILNGAACVPLSHSDVNDDISESNERDLCCICFEQVCAIEAKSCGHQMCAHCMVALCCHSKPNQPSATASAPLCPFCRAHIARLAVIKPIASKSTTLRRSTDGSSSFKSLQTVSPLATNGGPVLSENELLPKS